jgi:hypothetical protein
MVIFVFLASCNPKVNHDNLNGGSTNNTAEEHFEVSYSTVDEALAQYPEYLLKKLNGGQLVKEKIQHSVATGNLLKNDIALAILVTVLDPGGAGGNGYEQYLTVFTKNENGFVMRARRLVGARIYRSAHLESIESGSVELTLDLYKDNDPNCCPSVKATTGYDLRIFPSVSLEEGGLRVLDIAESNCETTKSEKTESSSSENSSTEKTSSEIQ